MHRLASPRLPLSFRCDEIQINVHVYLIEPFLLSHLMDQRPEFSCVRKMSQSWIFEPDYSTAAPRSSPDLIPTEGCVSASHSLARHGRLFLENTYSLTHTHTCSLTHMLTHTSACFIIKTFAFLSTIPDWSCCYLVKRPIFASSDFSAAALQVWLFGILGEANSNSFSTIGVIWRDPPSPTTTTRLKSSFWILPSSSSDLLSLLADFSLAQRVKTCTRETPSVLRVASLTLQPGRFDLCSHTRTDAGIYFSDRNCNPQAVWITQRNRFRDNSVTQFTFRQ